MPCFSDARRPRFFLMFILSWLFQTVRMRTEIKANQIKSSRTAPNLRQAKTLAQGTPLLPSLSGSIVCTRVHRLYESSLTELTTSCSLSRHVHIGVDAGVLILIHVGADAGPRSALRLAACLHFPKPDVACATLPNNTPLPCLSLPFLALPCLAFPPSACLAHPVSDRRTILDITCLQ